MFTACFGVVKFYRNGPMAFISNNGLLNGVFTLNFLVNLIGTMSFMVWRLMMMASMVTSTGYLIPLIFSPSIDLFSGHCNTIVGVQTLTVLKELQSDDIINPLWNCKFCEANEYGHVRCNDTGYGDRGTCNTDCDCPSCAPFCSAFNQEIPGYCQNNARYGRRSKIKANCGNELTPNTLHCKKEPIQTTIPLTGHKEVCEKTLVFV